MGFELTKDKNGYLINPSGRVLGYARVSTKDQHTDRQIRSLTDYGVKKENIVEEFESGKNFNRNLYRKLIRTLRRGDLLVITSLDRLGRNYQDIIDQWKLITQDIGCSIHVVDMPALNTSTDPDDLLSRFITDMMLQVLSFVAENERINLLQRQKEGIEAAKRRGIELGRAKAKISRDFWNVYIIWRSNLVRTKELIWFCTTHYNVGSRTFYRRLDQTNDMFKDVPVEELRTLDVEEYGAIMEELTGNDDERNADIPDLRIYSEEEILEEIMKHREEVAKLPKKKRHRRTKAEIAKAGGPKKRGRPPKTKKQEEKEAMTRTIIIE